jgi:hypothetical protein
MTLTHQQSGTVLPKVSCDFWLTDRCRPHLKLDGVWSVGVLHYRTTHSCPSPSQVSDATSHTKATSARKITGFFVFIGLAGATSALVHRRPHGHSAGQVDQILVVLDSLDRRKLQGRNQKFLRQQSTESVALRELGSFRQCAPISDAP